MSINIPWLEVLKACYPNAQITEDTEILVVSPQYTADIAVIMSTTDRWVYNTSRARNGPRRSFHYHREEGPYYQGLLLFESAY